MFFFPLSKKRKHLLFFFVLKPFLHILVNSKSSIKQLCILVIHNFSGGNMPNVTN